MNDKNCANIVDNLDKINKADKKIIPLRLDFFEKRDKDRSTLYSVNGPFQLIYADIADLRFLGKSATHPKYCLVAVDVYSSKIYMYPMQQRDLLAKKLKLFYDNVLIKRKKNKMRLQVDQEFQKNEIKDLNKNIT